jgi:hypothetical protein
MRYVLRRLLELVPRRDAERLVQRADALGTEAGHVHQLRQRRVNLLLQLLQHRQRVGLDDFLDLGRQVVADVESLSM